MSSLADLRARHRGPVIAAGDSGYEAARATFNGILDRRPELVTRPLDIDDVAAAVGYAVEAGLPVAVRGGGHGVAGHCVGDGSLVVVNRGRLSGLRASMDAGANASVLPALSVASLVGFGAVVAALPAFAVVRDWVLSIGGGPLVSLTVATNVLGGCRGSTGPSSSSRRSVLPSRWRARTS